MSMRRSYGPRQEAQWRCNEFQFQRQLIEKGTFDPEAVKTAYLTPAQKADLMAIYRQKQAEETVIVPLVPPVDRAARPEVSRDMEAGQ